MQVAAGENFALALDSSGHVHTWGYAADGALGDGPPTSEYRQSPAPIPGFIGVEKVAAGSHHAVALQAGGHMYTWGAGTYGALGQGDQTDRYQPHSVFIPDTVVNDIAAGHSYTLFIANGFVLGGFGLNDNWQLGDVGTDAQYEVLPVAINLSLVGLTRVFAGVNTGFVVNGQGDLHAWGGNVARIKGCCRGGQSEPDMVQVPGVRDVVMVGPALGHALVIDGAVQAAYGLGSNLQFRLGLPVSRILEAPELLPLSGSVTHVSSSSSYSALVMDGVVHVVGRNEYGKLARPPMHGFPEPVMIDGPPVAVSYLGE